MSEDSAPRELDSGVVAGVEGGSPRSPRLVTPALLRSWPLTEPDGTKYSRGLTLVVLVDLLEPAVTVPVHYDDYTVFRSPLSDFVARWQAVDPPGELRLVERGATVSLAP